MVICSNRLKSIFTLTILLFFVPVLSGETLSEFQQDSLWSVLKKSRSDTTTLSTSLSLIKYYYGTNDTTGFNSIIPYCEDKLNLLNADAASILNYQGYYLFKYERNIIDGRDKILEAIDIQKKLNLKEEMARSYVGLGIQFKRNAIFDEAISYYFKAIDIYEELSELKGLGDSYNNIANIFSVIDQHDKAIEYHHKSLLYRKRNQSQADMNISFLGLGLAYSGLDNVDSAEYYFEITIRESEKTGQFSIMAIATSSLGILYANQGDFEKALPYYSRALEIRESQNDLYGINYSKVNIGDLYLSHKFDPVIDDYCLDGYNYAVAANDILLQEQACGCLYKYYEHQKDYKSAFRYMKEYLTLHDSLSNTQDQANLLSKEISYEYSKKAAADSIEYAKGQELDKAKIALQDSEINARKNQQYALFGGIFLLVIFAGFMYNRFRISQTQKRIIEEQKEEVELQKELIQEKNKEVTDSIMYARRIQDAILPSRTALAENLKDGFVVFKPKDLVSGDFYWLERLHDKIYFAVADCTGHGVPGALVSIVCSNALSKALLEEKISDPGKLLDRTRELVVERLARSGGLVRDGMDISLVAIQDYAKNDVSKIGIEWAGANNPLWIYKSDQKIIEDLRPDKQPVGNHPDPKPFTSHKAEVEKGDVLFVFSDGYQDQFGGDKGKKFKAANFKRLLISLQPEKMDKQAKILEEYFDEWRGALEQIDDVCIIGVRI